MVKHFTRAQLIAEIITAISGGPYKCARLGHGRAGNLLEQLLGIADNNFDVADAVGFELKTSLSANTPVTLFHKDPQPRGTRKTKGAMYTLIENFGWPSVYGDDGSPVQSFRTTIYGKKLLNKNGKEIIIQANNDKVSITHNNQEYAYWDANELVGIAASKLRNMMYVEAKALPENHVRYVKAALFEGFQPLKFIQAIEDGIIAIDFDARTNPGKTSIRNHGTKFRIKEVDLAKLYKTVTPIA